ncbi:MAG: hypothetical protein F4Y14_07710 [Acidobacteria bacterium]|nr:hypothetical protein [Acidobacteriota bacterium]
MHIDTPLSTRLEWAPALRFSLRGRINVFVEPSDDGPFPRVLAMRYADVSNYPEPIAVYSVCHAKAIASPKGQRDLNRLKQLGFGLVTVDPSGKPTVLFAGVPLVQVISEDEFKHQISGLPRGIRQRARECFDDYRSKPLNGVKSLSELLEGMIRKAGRDAVARLVITTGESKAPLAQLLDRLHEHFTSARAAIGGARKYIKECRNPAHHWSPTKKGEYRKYRHCRHHFLEGLQTIQSFRQAMKNSGLSGNVASA